MDKPKIGVIILTYNSQEYIVSCLRSVFASDNKNFTSVVVDNASKDATIAKIRQYFPSVAIIQNATNLGFAAGNNVGIKYFISNNFQYALILNPDTQIKKELLSELQNVFESNKKTAVAGPIITYLKHPGRIWFAGGKFNRYFCYTRHNFMNEFISKLQISSRKVDFITGACMMLRLSALKQIGLLPTKYFLYFEDVFFCQRAIKKGYLCFMLAKPLALHHVSAATGIAGSNRLSPLKAYYFARNPLLYIRDDVKGFNKVINYFGQFFIRLPYYLLQMIIQKDIPSFFSYLKGIRHGI